MSASHRITFPGSAGDALAARLELPDGPPRAYAVFAHCFTCGKDAVAAARVSRALTRHGIAVLRFDFTGLGQSGGDFGNTGFSSNLDDLVAAADHLRAHYAAPELLVGHSLGGAAVLAARHRIPEVRAVATIGAPADPAHVEQLLQEARAEIHREGEATVALGGREFCIRRAFLQDIAAQSLTERIRDLKAALLVMHAPQDEVVGVDNARVIFDGARHPKSFVALDGADHLLTVRADAEYAATVLAAWAGRYLSEAQDTDTDTDTGTGTDMAAAAADPGLPKGTVRVSEAGGHYRQIVTAGSHTFALDEPVPIGADTAANPYDLLLAALGGCTSITLRMYAERKGWPLEKATVTLRQSRIHGKDCEECETKDGHVSRIDRKLELTGPLTAEQRERLLQIADMCPVHRTLTNEIVIRTELL